MLIVWLTLTVSSRGVGAGPVTDYPISLNINPPAASVGSREL
jgi:hypothetical protein